MKNILPVGLMVLCVISANAQTAKNPFAKYGFKNIKAYSSTKGEFEEFHDNKEVVEIGSVLYNTKTKQVVGYAKDDSENEIAVAITALGIDPLCEKYPWISPYAYCNNNPVNAIDPDGRSTYVLNNGDGTYRVVGGNYQDDDYNIYEIQFKDGKYGGMNSIGLSTSLTSFYDSDNDQWRGTINPGDNSGKNFLDQLAKNDPEIGFYMDNAKTNQKYDFKATNGTDKVKYEEKDFYRGMPVGKTNDGVNIYTSARDVGNIAAGYVAGLNIATWDMARAEFDKLQSKQDNRPSVEGMSTQNAQYYGWQMGQRDMLKNPGMIPIRIFRSIPTAIKYLIK